LGDTLVAGPETPARLLRAPQLVGQAERSLSRRAWMDNRGVICNDLALCGCRV
jgi:hypothetical protein